MNLDLLLEGEGRESAAERLRDILLPDGGRIAVKPVCPEDLSEPLREAIDPISVAALIVSIPSAVLAVTDLVDRRRKRRKAQAMIDEAGRLRAAGKVTVYVLSPAGPVALERLGPDQLLELASPEADSAG